MGWSCRPHAGLFALHLLADDQPSPPQRTGTVGSVEISLLTVPPAAAARGRRRAARTLPGLSVPSRLWGGVAEATP